MTTDQVKYCWDAEVPPELLYGVHMRLDGGEVDTTICPGRRVNARDLENGAMNGRVAPPTSTDEIDWDAH